MKLKFEINNDLMNPKLNRHNIFHVVFTAVLTAFLPWWYVGYAFMFLWETGDGFKPWWHEYNANDWETGATKWLAKECLYSDKFSLQDVVYWNLSGMIIGIIGRLITGIY